MPAAETTSSAAETPASAETPADLSASVKAKVTVPLEDQINPAKLRAVYDSMAAKLASDGLDLAAIAANGAYFTNMDSTATQPALPLNYLDFPGRPMPSGSVRLSVLYNENPDDNAPFYQATLAIAAKLPPSCKVYLNKPNHYHVTVYMTSQPYDLRPDPYHAPDGRWDPTKSPAPHPDVIHAEYRDIEAIAAASPAPVLQVYRFVLTNTGTLLLCCTEQEGHVARLRQKFTKVFVGGPVKQSTILHISLLRILTPEALDAATLQALQEEMDRWSEALQGHTFHPDKLCHVHEEVFTTVEGPRRAFVFGVGNNKS